MIGSIVGGNYSDNFGRKNAICVFSGLMGISLIVHGFVPINVWIFCAFRIFQSMSLLRVER